MSFSTMLSAASFPRRRTGAPLLSSSSSSSLTLDTTNKALLFDGSTTNAHHHQQQDDAEFECRFVNEADETKEEEEEGAAAARPTDHHHNRASLASTATTLTRAGSWLGVGGGRRPSSLTSSRSSSTLMLFGHFLRRASGRRRSSGGGADRLFVTGSASASSASPQPTLPRCSSKLAKIHLLQQQQGYATEEMSRVSAAIVLKRRLLIRELLSVCGDHNTKISFIDAVDQYLVEEDAGKKDKMGGTICSLFVHGDMFKITSLSSEVLGKLERGQYAVLEQAKIELLTQLSQNRDVMDAVAAVELME